MVADLSVTRLTPALVRPLGVDAQLLANVLARRTLVQVPARAVVGVQQVAGGTTARVTSFQIQTRHLARRRHGQAFVEVCGETGRFNTIAERITIRLERVSRENSVSADKLGSRRRAGVDRPLLIMTTRTRNGGPVHRRKAQQETKTAT